MGQNNFILDLIAGLKKTASKQQIKSDVKALGDISIKLVGNLNITKTRQNIKNQLKGLNNLTFNITPKVNTKGVQQSVKQTIKSAQNTANKNKINYSYSFDVDKQKLQNELKIFARENSKLFSDKTMTMKYDSLVDSAGVAKSKTEVNGLRKELSAFRTELAACNKAGMTWTDKFKASISHFMQYWGGASFIYAVTDQLREAWTSAKTIDDKLVDLQKVTDEISDRDALYNYFDKAMSKAQELNVKVDSLISAVTEFKKLGWSLSDAESGGKWATILQNVGDVDIDTAIGSIKTAVASFDKIGGYGNDQMDKKIEAYVDLINNMSNKYSIDAQGLAESIRLSAGTLTEAHTTIEQAATMFATANKYYNDPSYLGNTAKIGSLRMRASKGDKDAVSQLKDMGEEVDNLSGATSKLRDQLLSLTGVDIMKDDGKTFKSYYEQLKEIADVIDQLDDTSRANVLETLFGKNRAAGGAALLSGMKESAGAYQDAINSAGSATQEYETWMQSADAATQRFSNNLVKTYQSIINGNTIRDLANLGSAVLEFANKFGLIEGALRGFLSLKIGQFITNGAMAFVQATKSVEQYGKALQLANNIPNGNLAQRFNTLKSIAQATESLTTAQLKQVLSNKTLSQEDRIRILQMQNLSREAAIQKLNEMGLTQATNAQTAATTASTTATFSLKSAMVGLGATIKGVFLSNPVGIALMGISVAVSAITSAVSSHNQKMEESIQKSKEMADQANTAGDEIADLTAKYLKLADAVKTDSSAKEELMSTQEELLQKLGIEGESIDGLIKKYGSLDEAIKQVSLDSLKESENDLIAGVNATRKELLKAGKDGLFSADNIINATGDDAVKAFMALEKAGVVEKGSYNPDGGGGSLVLTGDTKTVDGILENYQRLEDAMNALRESNAFTAEELSDNSLYQAIYGRYSDLKESVDAYKTSIANLNENLAQQTVLSQLQGRDLPKTQEEYEKFKQNVIDAAVASKKFIGNQSEVESAVSNYLDSVPEFSDYTTKLEEANTAQNSLVNDGTSAISSFSKAWLDLKSSTDEMTKDLAENLMELAEKGQLSVDTFNEADSSGYFKGLGISADEATKKINAMVDSSTQLESMSSQISKMSDMLADKKNGTVASASDLAGFDVEVRGLDSWSEFEKVMGSSKSTMDECQKAANALATEWVNSNNFLSQLNDTNKDYYVTQLNNMGVENASAVVEGALAQKKQEEAMVTDYATAATEHNSEGKNRNNQITTDLTKATIDEIIEIAKEGNVSDETANSLYNYALEKSNASNLTIATAADCNNLYNLCSALGVASEALKNYAYFKSVMESASKMENPDMAKATMQAAQNGLNYWKGKAQKEVKDAYNLNKKQVKTTVKPTGSSNYKGGSTGGKSKSGSGKDKTKDTKQTVDWIERKISSLNDHIDLTQSKLDNLFNIKSPKNLSKKINSVSKSLKTAQDNTTKWQKALSKIKIPASAKKLIQSGKKVQLSKYSKSEQKNIKKYQSDWKKYSSWKKKASTLENKEWNLETQRGKESYLKAQEKDYNTLAKVEDKAYKKYLSKAKSVKLSSSLKKKVRSGDYRINDYSSATQQKIQEYQQWWDKAQDAKKGKYEAKKNARDKKSERYQSYIDDAENNIAKLDAQMENSSSYKERIKYLKEERDYIKDNYYYQIKQAELNGELVKADELRAKRQKELTDNTIAQYQEKVDNTEAKIAKSQAYAELDAGNYKEQNKHLEYQKKQLKQQYDYLIKIAKLNKDSVEVSKLKAEYQKELNDLIKQEYDNIVNTYDNKSKLNSDKKNAIQDQIDLLEARGEKIGSALYTKQIALDNTELKRKQEERAVLIKKLAEIPKNTDSWYDAQDKLYSVDSSIVQLQTDMVNLQKSINQLKFDRFDDLLDKLNDIVQETDFLKDMLDSDNLFDKNGMITDDGITAMGLTAQNYDVYLAEAEKYKQMLSDVKDMYDAGTISLEEYEEYQRKYSQSQRNAIKSANDAKKAVIDYVRQGLDAQNEALSKSIDKQKSLLEAEKD